ncbi:P-loop containing nucleoside triphosphate hydrolase protein [Leucosporidium creatinivorum]|uniref:p-loop containing nucleoside triphosphate hydrolase protein n=1 Tax=Leucosporidium creatinivorum TaxID=106004 RepID=A0A1Y2G2F0_9BASI|nr:P-loop containing nucleoside triphosphate hydrolase protein [Leucosporidium creatinivorum]
MPVLEFAPPAPTSPRTTKHPLSPSRVSSINSPPPLPATTLKPALKSPKSAGNKRLPDENGVRFEGSSSPNTWEGAGHVERAEEQGESQQSQQSVGEDTSMSMDLQSEDGGATEEQEQELQRLRGGGGGPELSASTSTSSFASSSDRERVPLHVEVRMKPPSSTSLVFSRVRAMVAQHLDNEYETLLLNSAVEDWREVAGLEKHIERIWIGECAVHLSQVTLQIHVYQPPSSSKVTEFSTNAEGSEEDDGDDVPAASVLQLPSRSLEGLWDTLVYEGDVKGKLLGYIYSTMLFSDAMVDFNIVTWNRVVLLHGPPGTGKTSLCRALAQKLAIRLSDRYQHGKLIEINSHSLFSKWFSESGKLVQRLFAQVTEMVEDESGFVVVLIDEVESLTAARAGAMSGKEPSDALRVVNALLTQLDKLKHRKNVLVMTTSNLSAAIDGAFIDRADIKQYIGLPPPQAVYWILQSCLREIMRAGLISPTTLLDWNQIALLRDTGVEPSNRDEKCSEALWELAHACQKQQFSGRTLRRLPVLAHARHLGLSSSISSAGQGTRMEQWLEAMRKCVEEEVREMGKIEENE